MQNNVKCVRIGGCRFFEKINIDESLILIFNAFFIFEILV